MKQGDRWLETEDVSVVVERPGTRTIRLDRGRHTLDVYLGGAVSDYACKGAVTREAEPCPPDSFRFLRAGSVDEIVTTRSGTTLRLSFSPGPLERLVDPARLVDAGGGHRYDDALIGVSTTLVEHLDRRAEPCPRTRTGPFAEMDGQVCRVLLGRLAHCLDGPPDPGGVRRSEAVQRALAHVEANLDRALTLERVADTVGLSQYHFARLFRRETGTSLQRYVIFRRIERARELLLRTDRKLADIAYEVGFGSQSHMTTLFRRHAGRTPGEIRRARRCPSVPPRTATSARVLPHRAPPASGRRSPCATRT